MARTHNIKGNFNYENVEKKEFDTFSRDEVRSNDDDELSTPPFFRRKR